MHDLDYPPRELEDEEFEDEFEFEFEDEFDEVFDDELEGEFDQEFDELALATELLEITDEAELEEFLGKLLSTAGGMARKAVASPTGKALVGILRDSARAALPKVGAVLGDAVMPGKGGKSVGAGAGAALGGLLGLELEGLSDDDAEFETAKTFVRFAKTAGQCMPRWGVSGSPTVAAKRAAVTAARRHALPLASMIAKRPVRPARTAPLQGGRRGRSGSWVRRGNTIVLRGV